MRRFVLSSFAALLAILGLASCAVAPSQQKVVLVVAATDNFRPVLEQLAQDYCFRQPWVSLELHTATTATLEQDFKKGVAFDLYIPARPDSMIALANSDAINPRSIVVLPHNELVVVAPPESELRLAYMDYTALSGASVRQIAVAKPDLLLGYLTREAFISLKFIALDQAVPPIPASTPAATAPDAPPNLATTLASSTNLSAKLLYLDTEADVLAAVKDGRAQAGITFNTAALADKKVRILTRLPDGAYEPLEYSAGIPRNAPHNDEAWNFLNYLRSREALATMQRNGLSQ